MPAVITEQSTVLESLHLVVVLLSTSLFLLTTIVILCLKKNRQKPGASPPVNNVAPEEDRKKKNVDTNEKKNAEKVSDENLKTGAHSATSATPRKNQNATPKKDRANPTSERKTHERIQLEKTAKLGLGATQPSAEPDGKQEPKLKGKPRIRKTREADGKAVDRSEDGSDTLKSVESIQNPAEGVQAREH